MQLTHAQRVGLFTRPYTPSFNKGSIRAFLNDINQHSPIIIEYAANFLDTGKVITLCGFARNHWPGAAAGTARSKDKPARKEQQAHHYPLPGSATGGFFYYLVFRLRYYKRKCKRRALADATIWHPARQRGSYSNNHGYYTLQLPEGKNILYLSYAGYETHKMEINLKANTRLDVHLTPRANIEEVTVTSCAQSARGR